MKCGRLARMVLMVTVQLIVIPGVGASEVHYLGVPGNSASISESGAIAFGDNFGTYIETNSFESVVGTFQRVVTVGDAVPGGTLSLVTEPLILPDDHGILFRVRRQDPGFAYYLADPIGGIRLVADSSTVLPGTSNLLAGFSAASVAYPYATFCAGLRSTSGEALGSGLFRLDLRGTAEEPILIEVVQFPNPLPTYYDTGCSSFPSQLVGNGQGAVVHHYRPGGVTGGYGPNTIDVITPDGIVTNVVKEGDLAPDNWTFQQPSTPRINAEGAVAFIDYTGSESVIYIWDATHGVMPALAPQTPVPDRPGMKFEVIREYRLLPDRTIVFSALINPNRTVLGIYRIRPPYQEVEVVFDSAAPVAADGEPVELFYDLFTGQACTSEEILSNVDCVFAGHVTLGQGGSFANDMGKVTFGLMDMYGRHYLFGSISEVGNAVATPTGSEIAVEPEVTLPDGSSTTTVQLIFDSVQSMGTTTVSAGSTPTGVATESPSRFKVGTPPVYYDVTTTASYTGTVALCFSWQDGEFKNENNIKLFHFENGAWQDVTTSLDTAMKKVCGQVTSLSPFALFETSYAFSGFLPPVHNLPTQNIVKAGSGIPVKFSLGGDRGLAILATGYPIAQPMTCDGGAPSDQIDETTAAGASGLSYDISSDQYTYVWKTAKAWSKSCKRLVLQFSDGSQYSANFAFSK